MFTEECSFCADLGTRITLPNLFISEIIVARIHANAIDENDAFLIFSFVHSLNSFFELNPFSGIFFNVASSVLVYWKFRLINSSASVCVKYTFSDLLMSSNIANLKLALSVSNLLKCN